MSVINQNIRPSILDAVISEFKDYSLQEIRRLPVSGTTFDSSTPLEFKFPESQNVNLAKYTVYGTLTINTAGSYVNPIEYFINSTTLATPGTEIEKIDRYAEGLSLIYPVTCTSEHAVNRAITSIGQHNLPLKIVLPDYHFPLVADADEAFIAAASAGTFTALFTAMTNSILDQIEALTGTRPATPAVKVNGADLNAATQSPLIITAINLLIAEIRTALTEATAVSLKDIATTVLAGAPQTVATLGAAVATGNGLSSIQYHMIYLVDTLNRIFHELTSSTLEQLAPQYYSAGSKTPFATSHWLGVLGSINIPVINTNFVGDLTHTINWMPASVLSSSAATYTISKAYATFEVITYPAYTQYLDSMYTSAESGGIQYSFDKVLTNSKAISSGQDATFTHTINAKNIKNIYFTTKATTYATAGYTPGAFTTNYFKNSRNEIDTISFNYGSLTIPTGFPHKIGDHGYNILMTAMNVNNNNTFDSLINSKFAFDSCMFLVLWSLQFPDPSDNSFSGVATYGKGVDFNFQLKGDGSTDITACQGLSMALVKAKLIITAPRAVYVDYI